MLIAIIGIIFVLTVIIIILSVLLKKKEKYETLTNTQLTDNYFTKNVPEQPIIDTSLGQMKI